MSKPTNRLISIGYLGFKTCYLNTSREEAIQRWMAQEDADPEQTPTDDMIHEFEFTDQFEAYEVWKS